MPLDLERPAFESGLSSPKQLFIAMEMPSIGVVFCCVIAKKTQIKKIGSAWQEFERREVSFVKRSGIRPHPANAIPLQEVDNVRPVPPGMTKFNCETKVLRQSAKKIAQGRLTSLWCERRRKLDKNSLQLWSQRLDCVEKRIQLSVAIAQLAGVGDLARQFTGEPKSDWSNVKPATKGAFRRDTVKRRICFHRGKVFGVEFEPSRIWEIRWIKSAAPVFEAPCACADAYFLLIG